MPTKTKKTQPKLDTSGRNNFQTPLYALNLIIPYIPERTGLILEPAAGQMRLVDYLRKKYYYRVTAQDLYPVREDCFLGDFLKFKKIDIGDIDCIITNPPFSLKFEFITKCLELNIPFALLIPFDMCGFLHDKFKNDGLGAIIPNRRIDYLTPNIVQRVNDGETLFGINKSFEKSNRYKSLQEVPHSILFRSIKVDFKSIDEVPVKIIKKYSSSDFHSFWITKGFNQPEKFTFVNLSLEDKKNVV
jgi:hypothetical protein